MSEPNLFRLIFIFALSSTPLELTQAPAPHFVVWNVGQGQWTTLVAPALCLHFDTGGEYFPWSQIIKHCKSRRNYVLYTHHDSDHINAAQKYPFKKLNACSPVTLPANKFRYVRICSDTSAIKTVKALSPKCNKRKCSRNDMSSIFLTHRILISGDSPVAQEAWWRPQLDQNSVRAWILGHHGSRTSNGKETFKLLRPKIAIASARTARYGHPHFKTLWTAKQAKVSVLKTEDWGNIHLEL